MRRKNLWLRVSSCTMAALLATTSVAPVSAADFTSEIVMEDTQDEAADLNYVIRNMKKTTEVRVDKSSLYEMLKTAQNMSGREDVYTEASLKALNSAITAAEKVYKNDDATQSEVNEQVSALSTAITNLKKQSGGNSSNSSNNNNNSSNNTNNSDSLDINNLADGVYSISGSMVKTDKKTASMSNEAINRTIKLTVKKGKYYLTMDFKGMTINNQYGYLGKLKYFKTGYTLDKYGSPQGSLGNVTVNSYQKYSDGTKVSDNFGTDYPDVVTFPMISEALKDGYVPLQVFVPIMDSISRGTGTQPVFLKLDWSSIKKTSSSDSAFKDDSTNTKSDGTGSGGSGTTGTGGLQNTLKTGSSLGGNSLSTNKLGTSSLGGSSLKSSSSSLKASGSSSLKKTGKTALTSTSKTGTSASSKAALKSTAAAAGAQSAGTTGSGTATAKSAEDVGKVVIPSVLSSLAALAGIFYKLKSRIIK